MKTYFVACLLLLSLFLQAGPITWDGKSKSLLIGQDILILEEKDKPLSIEDISSGAYAQKFAPSDKKILDFALSSSEYWIKISVQNKTNEKLVLEVAQALLPSVEFFFKDSAGKWQTYKAGYTVEPDNKIIHHHFQLFPLNGKDGEYYIRFKANGTPVPIRIWKDDIYESKITSQKITYGVYMGIMLFVILLNLFLFFSLRRFTYLHYAALVFLFATFSAIFDGYITYLFPKIDLMFWYFLNPIINQPNGLLFCLLFLDVKKYVPRMHKFAIAVLIYFTSYIVWFNFLPSSTALALNQLHALFGILLMATLGIRTGMKGNRLGYYYALVYFVFFTIATIEVVYDRTGSPSYFFELSHVSIAIFMEVFMLAYLLSLRFKWEKSEIEIARADAQKQLLEKTLENQRIIREQNVVLEQKVEERTLALKETQQQLIQKEKLASLGQLTAGIAHEIKNPLNFINNFTDLTREMVGELITSDNLSEKTALSGDIQNNLEKISFHGKRVDEIVKGMLLHSRVGSAEKQNADINQLCDDAVNLSVHGMKPGDAEAASHIERIFETGLPPVPVVAQDFSRVILNLINNAVYAVRGNPDSKISISTSLSGNSVIISVKDNGTGIAENIKSKIFQPFFTTKPAGDGTGLGLSISYDIVKSHNGEIEVNTFPEGGAEFCVVLPLDK
jgi:signal transduction histidine kinase